MTTPDKKKREANRKSYVNKIIQPITKPALLAFFSVFLAMGLVRHRSIESFFVVDDPLLNPLPIPFITSRLSKSEFDHILHNLGMVLFLYYFV